MLIYNSYLLTAFSSRYLAAALWRNTVIWPLWPKTLSVVSVAFSDLLLAVSALFYAGEYDAGNSCPIFL
jgi:hypothetical protein